MKERSSRVNPYSRDPAGGESRDIFTDELHSGAISIVLSVRNGGNIVNNPKWQILNLQQGWYRVLNSSLFIGEGFFYFPR